MTTSSGTKFGKTEAGTIWLDPSLTSPFRFYQFWLNTDDRDVVKYLKFFTWLDQAMIDGARTAGGHGAREARRPTHARERSHEPGARPGRPGEGRTETAALFGGGDARTIAPSMTLPGALVSAGMAHTEFLVSVGLAASKGEAVRLIKQGGFYLNDERVTDERGRVTLKDVVDGKIKCAQGPARTADRPRRVGGGNSIRRAVTSGARST